MKPCLSIILFTWILASQAQANETGQAPTQKPAAYGVFDEPLKTAIISLKRALAESSVQSNVPAEAFRLYLCAERFQRRYSTDAWQRVSGEVDDLLAQALALYTQGSRPSRHIASYRLALASGN